MYTAYVYGIVVSITRSKSLQVTQYTSVQEFCNQENVRTEGR